jgi:hypothetical protein
MVNSLGNMLSKEELDFSDYVTQFNLTQLAMCDTAAQNKSYSIPNKPNDSAASSQLDSFPAPATFSQKSSGSNELSLSGNNCLNMSSTLTNMFSDSNNKKMPSFSDFSHSSQTSEQHKSLIMSSKSDKPTVMQIRWKFGHLGSNKGQFSSPHGFCLGADEEIVIADTYNHRICIFDKTGEFKFQFGIAGKEEGELWHPRKVIRIHFLDFNSFIF